jgi:hypothetical protein
MDLPKGYVKNPFAAPIEKIRRRIRDDSEKRETIADANEGREADVNETPEVELPGQAKGVLELLVVNRETKEPLAQVKLSIAIHKDGPDEERAKVTDQQGLCGIELGWPRPAYVRVRAEEAGFVPVELELLRDTVGVDFPAKYTISLEPGTLIGGFVVAEQGEPVEVASVYLRVPADDLRETSSDFTVARRGSRTAMDVSISDYEVKTDANGFWRCDVMPAALRDIEIRLAHPEYIDDESYGVTDRPSMQELRQMIGVMVMKKGYGVRGTVFDSSGRPVEGATVAQGSDRRDTYYPSTRTDASGRFEFKNARPGEMVLTAQAQGSSPDLKEIVVDGAAGSVEFRLGPAHTIRGQVVDSQYDPLVGAWVFVNGWRGHRSLEWETNTDSQGRFEWHDAPADEVQLFIGKRNFRTVLDFAAIASDDEYLIVMLPPLRISGIVADADSREPINEFWLIPGIKSGTDGQVYWERGKTARYTGGTYDFRFCCPDDGLFIRIEAEGYMPRISRAFGADEGDVPFDFVLERGRKAAGTVYLPNGEPAAGVEVAVGTTSQTPQIENGELLRDTDLQIVETGLDGWFSFQPQFEPYLLVAVGDEGYAKVMAEQFETSGRLVLEPWARVEGALHIGGRAGASETVTMHYYQAREPDVATVSYYYESVTDADGLFVLDRVVPGTAKVTHEVKFSLRDTAYSHAELIEVQAGQTVSLTLGGMGRAVMGRIMAPEDYNEPIDWAYARGTVSLKLPQPARPYNFDRMSDEEKQTWTDTWRQSEQGGAYEQFHWEKSRSYVVGIDQDGAFSVEDLPAGSYDLRIHLYTNVEDRPLELGELIGLLNYQFEIFDIDAENGTEPLDIGTVTIQMQEAVKGGDRPGPF